jgi:phosphatidylserine decarboxylase
VSLKRAKRPDAENRSEVRSHLARAQETAVPVIGYLNPQSAENQYKIRTAPFLQGLKETGYVEGQNVAVEYRYAENEFDRLPELAVVNARTASDIETAFATFSQQHVGAVLVSAGTL